MAPASPEKLNASLDAHRRIARLAIARFAVDAVRVENLLREAQELVRQGTEVDFVEVLVEAQILSEDQAERLRVDQPTPEVLAFGEETAEPRVTKLDLPDGAKDPKQMGRYRILRMLGQGGMGAVYLAFDSQENRHVAVKVLAADQAPKQNILSRFHREGTHGAMLVHDNIVRSYDMGRDEPTGLHYIVLEYVDGPTAHDLLEQSGRLEVGDAVHIILDIARALEHAHKKQIIHRDIKPANILLTSSGLAKLSDLGLAKRRGDSANLTNAAQGIGTPYYMPYEQAMNAKTADERSDIYALGATLYHLVAGEVPFEGESSLEIVEKKGIGVFSPARSLNPEVPERLDEILTRLLARNPSERYQTVSEVIVDLERSQLAATIPSFVHIDRAMQDPIVRQRLTSPVEATQPDLQVQQAILEKKTRAEQPWYLRYKDQRGNLCKSKATTAQIVDRIKKGTMPLHTEASQSPQGKFKPLEKWPEFHAVPQAAPANRISAPEQEADAEPARWQPWWLFAAAALLGVSIIGILAATAFILVRNL